MRIEDLDGSAIGDDTVEALLRGLAETNAALCICDADDVIRYANATFRAAFCPEFDGRPADFTRTIVDAHRAGIGIKLISAAPEEFAPTMRRRRRELLGSRSFAADMMNGGWWSVTDTKLSNGWMLAIAQDISALKHEEAKLRDAHESALVESQTDYLTGAPNRRHGLRRAEALWKEARGSGGLSIALLDVDHFKTINDVYGHEAGDRALVHLACHMMASIDPTDQFSRLGGDEFLLIRPSSAVQSLERGLKATLAAMPRIKLDHRSEPLRLSISVGLAVSRPDDTWPGLVHRADMALYDAKADGRDRISRAA